MMNNDKIKETIDSEYELVLGKFYILQRRRPNNASDAAAMLLLTDTKENGKEIGFLIPGVPFMIADINQIGHKTEYKILHTNQGQPGSQMGWLTSYDILDMYINGGSHSLYIAKWTEEMANSPENITKEKISMCHDKYQKSTWTHSIAMKLGASFVNGRPV